VCADDLDVPDSCLRRLVPVEDSDGDLVPCRGQSRRLAANSSVVLEPPVDDHPDADAQRQHRRAARARSTADSIAAAVVVRRAEPEGTIATPGTVGRAWLAALRPKHIALGAIAAVVVTAAALNARPPSPQSVHLVAAPGRYAHDMSTLLVTENERPRDADGTILVRYPSGLHYNPVTISQNALAHYDRWLQTHEESDRAVVVKAARWLKAAQGPAGLWSYDVPNGSMPVPWVSAMAQGQAASVLVRAASLSRDESYLRAADAAIATYDRLSGAAGVASVDDGYVYFEETMPPYSPHILNGMVFAMYGAWDLWKATGKVEAKELFDAGVRTLRDNLHKYDAGNWSYYNQAKPPGLASRFYHGLHVELLRELFAMTGVDVFRDYADRFARYAAHPPPGVAG
jgi:hypothetical protein